ncbi:unnamed protein product [marine sediment metagenome]|uniref:Uncharacterized protein n=1 Tax=marine sediment metagenome TaxID=412755 RepID=X1E688_9ZZZZ
MKLLFTILALLIATPTLGASFQVTIPDTSVADLQIACDYLATRFRAKDPTNSECGAMLIRMGQERVAKEIITKAAERTKRDTIKARVAEVLNDFPVPLRDAVCGDGELDSLAGEQCDNGGSNSATVPDACRLSCRPAYCGDGVVDTGEVCDGAGCLSDCSGIE